MWLTIAELVCVRCFQHDKFESKIVEVDYEIPPNVGMTNYAQKKSLDFKKSVLIPHRNPKKIQSAKSAYQ